MVPPNCLLGLDLDDLLLSPGFQYIPRSEDVPSSVYPQECIPGSKNKSPSILSNGRLCRMASQGDCFQGDAPHLHLHALSSGLFVK